ncbi:MAG: transglycosylase SLT domain-containing protein [Acidobacteria bacterium]|nr:transglycosylase SLT domain-containing protein [Acidobacteriota bacterium]
MWISLRSAAWIVGFGVFCATLQATPPELRVLSAAYQKSGSAADREKLERLAEKASAADRRLILLALASGDRAAEKWAEAAHELHKASESAGPLGDYVDYLRAHSLARAERHEDAAWVLRSFQKDHAGSRLIRDANRLRAESLIRANGLPQAQALLEDQQAPFSEPVRFYLLGRVQEERGFLPEAVQTYRRAYYFYPFSDQADASEQRLDLLRVKLGTRYPDPPAKWRLARADALYTGGDYARAASEYARAWPGLDGVDQQRAKVRLGAADYRRVHTTAAHDWLSGVRVTDPELAAERLYYLGECARRLKRTSEFLSRAEELSQKHSKSPWTEEAFFSLGNFYLLEKDEQTSRKWYERAAKSFPKGQYSDRAHWKVCWRAFLDGDPRVRDLFEEHARLYPSSGQASAAMYWLARLIERDGDASTAQGLYRSISERYPQYYYAWLAEQRLQPGAAPQLTGLAADLDKAAPPYRKLLDSPSAANAQLIERGRLLFEIGLDDDARRELSSGDYRSADAHWIGLELARQSAANGDHFQGMRYMKRYGFGYLRMPMSAQSREFWERLYPLPFEDSLRQRAQPHGLDPYLVAGLIRQESEFNPRAVSRAGARGLMQLMPSTGKALARELGVSGFSTGKLFEPDVSLRFGTYHLKQVIDKFQGELELALAAYNAGASRAEDWITWAEFPEPAAFVETIPFTETRGYVQAVLRNRETYRKIYDGAAAMRSTTPSREQIAGGE